MTRFIGFSQVLTVALSVFFLGPSLNALAFDLQGHRGARGLMPENTLAGFARALTIGVTTLELDVGVSRDNIVVVSHNPALNKSITRDKSGKWLDNDSIVIHDADYKGLKQFDVGRINPASRYASRFPNQSAVDGEVIPTLGQVFELAQRHGNTQVRFNIETKLHPEKPDLTLPPLKFVQALLKVIRRHHMSQRVTVQSFDWRTLQLVQKLAPEIPTTYLTVAQSWLDTLQPVQPGLSPWLAGFDIDQFYQNVPRTVKAAGGKVWSPYHKEVSAQDIIRAHELDLKVIVWTVNNEARMKALIALNVDGIITDYPDRLRAVLQKLGKPLPAATPPE